MPTHIIFDIVNNIVLIVLTLSLPFLWVKYPTEMLNTFLIFWLIYGWLNMIDDPIAKGDSPLDLLEAFSNFWNMLLKRYLYYAYRLCKIIIYKIIVGIIAFITPTIELLLHMLEDLITIIKSFFR